MTSPKTKKRDSNLQMRSKYPSMTKNPNLLTTRKKQSSQKLKVIIIQQRLRNTKIQLTGLCWKKLLPVKLS